jgi:hypothetical protein
MSVNYRKLDLYVISFFRTSNLPALFVFGKAPIDIVACAEAVGELLSSTEKETLV